MGQFFIYIRARDIIDMVDLITSLKVRLARLRLGSEFDEKYPELRDPASDSLDKKRGKKKQKKAKNKAPDYSKLERKHGKDKFWNAVNKPADREVYTLSDFKPEDLKTPEGKKTVEKVRKLNEGAKVRKAQDPYNEYTTNTGGKRKKKNKLTRSDQKRGKKDKEKVRGSYNRTKRQEGSTQDYKKSGFCEYTKNTGDKRKKKNKLTRSDQKRP